MLKKTGLPNVANGKGKSGHGKQSTDNSLTISHNIQQQKRLNGVTSITPVMISTEEIERLDNNYYDQNEYPTEYGQIHADQEQILQKEERRALMRFKALRFYKMNNRRAFKSKVNENLENMYAQNQNMNEFSTNKESAQYSKDEYSYMSNSDIKMSDKDELNRNYNHDRNPFQIGPIGNLNAAYAPRHLGDNLDTSNDRTSNIYNNNQVPSQNNTSMNESSTGYDMMNVSTTYQDYDLQSKDLLKYKKSLTRKPFLHKIVRKANPTRKRIPAENGIDFYQNEQSYNICRLLGANTIIPKGVNMRYIAKNIMQSPNHSNLQLNNSVNLRKYAVLRNSEDSSVKRANSISHNSNRPRSNYNQQNIDEISSNIVDYSRLKSPKNDTIMTSTAKNSHSYSKNGNDAPIKIINSPNNIIDRITTGYEERNINSNRKRIVTSSAKQTKKLNQNSVSTEINDYYLNSYDNEYYENIYEDSEHYQQYTGPPIEFTINEMMNNKFMGDKVIDKKFIKHNWKDMLFIFRQRWVIISNLSHFERILNMWKETLFTDLLCDKPELLRDLLVIYFKTAEECYSNMALNYKAFLINFFDIIKYLLSKIEGMDNALIYAFSSLFKKNSNFLYLFPEECLKLVIEEYMDLINIYLKKCIDYFMGESDQMTIIKFNTFDFSETLEYIFKYSHIIYKFMKDPEFLQKMELMFNNFYTFCMNHNEFSRLNESIVLTILESFSCVMIMLKHQKIYLYFITRFEHNLFYQD